MLRANEGCSANCVRQRYGLLPPEQKCAVTFTAALILSQAVGARGPRYRLSR